MSHPFAEADPEHLLFVYGTLLPGEERWPILEQFVIGDGHPDAVAGTLYDTGEGYPAAAFEHGDGRVAGRVFRLDAGRLAEALEVLDEVEDAVLGLYRRVRVATDAGFEVWTYQHGEGLTLTPIAGGDWLTR
jgi:gamma-glutamylcyclotransferase (GGCT)/AIG2-like uncharacterized protein YtfP